MNIMSEWFIEAANYCCGALGPTGLQWRLVDVVRGRWTGVAHLQPCSCLPAPAPHLTAHLLHIPCPTGNFEYGEDEMQLSGLTPLPSVKASHPRFRQPARAAAHKILSPRCCFLHPQTRLLRIHPQLCLCCATLPHPRLGAQVKPPRVKESAVHMECQLRHSYDVKDKNGAVTGTIVIGEVVMMHVHEGVAGAWRGCAGFLGGAHVWSWCRHAQLSMQPALA